ncbi:MAG TPA: carbohydrate porin [Nitrospirota bacterium]|nr:carbohydrate porin [Nitrospirota bacterium]
MDILKETLTKDWASYRTWLANIGITHIASYTVQFMGNTSGGQRQGFTYAGTLQDLVSWDLHKILGSSGLSFNIGASYASGRNLTKEYIGNTFTVQSAYNGNGNLNLQEMFLRQQSPSGTLTVAIGRMAPADVFATLPVFNNYINAAVNPIPGSLGLNDSSFTTSPPGVEWGALSLYNITQTVQIAAGIYNTNPSSAAGEDHGLNFAFQQGNTGILTIAQVSYLYNQAKGDVGLPGEYTIGGFYDSNDFSSLNNPSGNVNGNYGIFAMFQQMVYRDGKPDSKKGLTLWSESAISLKQNVSTVPVFVGLGLSYRGLIPRRGDDIASMAVLYGKFSEDIPQASNEAVIETNYQITLTPWLLITPDFQYIMKPSGNSNIPNAVVLGFQLVLLF